MPTSQLLLSNLKTDPADSNASFISLFRTPDLPLAVALMISHHPLSQISPLSRDRFFFVFQDSPALQDTILAFHKKEIEAPVQTTINLIRALKARLKYAAKEIKDS